jgi:secreted trypsin-like serine protease
MIQEAKIANGKLISRRRKRRHYSWYGTLHYQSRFICGGCYIGENAYLTAAHCVYGFHEPSNFSVKFKNYLRDGKGQVLRVKAVHIHPRYNPKTFDFDVAVLCLESKPNNIKSMRLAKCGCRTTTGKRMRVIGYGKATEYGPLNDRPHEISIKVSLRQNYPSEWITNQMFTAHDVNNPLDENDNEDACQGDSGSPAFIFHPKKKQYRAVGIVSWGVGCALDNYPGVYSKVSSFRRWIIFKRKICSKKN